MVTAVGNKPSVIEQARAEVQAEINDKAKRALVVALRTLAQAQAVVSNQERVVADLEASIRDGSFVG